MKQDGLKVTVEFETDLREHTGFFPLEGLLHEEMEVETYMCLFLKTKYYVTVKEKGKQSKKVCVGSNMFEIFDSVINPYLPTLYGFNRLAGIAQDTLPMYVEDGSTDIAVLMDYTLNLDEAYQTEEVVEQILRQIEEYVFIVLKSPVLVLDGLLKYGANTKLDDVLLQVYKTLGYAAMIDEDTEGLYVNDLENSDCAYKYQADYLAARKAKMKTDYEEEKHQDAFDLRMTEDGE